MKDSRWHQYLFEQHSPDRLQTWARSLRYFRFCRAYGGHANDGDQLLVAIGFDGVDDLLSVCDGLGITLAAPGGPAPVTGVTYTGAEWAKLAFPIQAFPQFAQPGWVRLADHNVHVHVGHDVRISAADEDERYDVTETAVAAAQRIEGLLAPIQGRIIDPPQNDRNCICPQQYPEFWDTSYFPP
ncbi:hypothetical protein [Antrihabitans cavernicola]|uniref:Uncharacterized protein n=1 Tax=Antrihabitans cavernicola TaxID=2495913 RepID=A0A5A7SAL3_9NOCA|nr:hypothetical protein [Spelaeibacter cavernicola]KAA0022339.1 hypothetical protein FOY51_15325 [Spelaeibacter cavernicola]